MRTEAPFFRHLFPTDRFVRSQSGCLQEEPSQHDEVIGEDGKVHVALKVSPTLPEAAGKTKDPFGGGDAPLNAGPKAPQLLIHPAGAHHVLDG